MSTGVKESREVFVFVIALVNVLVSLAGLSPLALLGHVGDLIRVLVLAGPAVKDWRVALAEGLDGYSDDEKKVLYAEVERLELPVETIEQTAEKIIKAGIALLDVLAWVIPHKTGTAVAAAPAALPEGTPA
jgi:hypothetical protein